MIFGLKTDRMRACRKSVRSTSKDQLHPTLRLSGRSHSNSNHIFHPFTFPTPCEAMVREAVQKSKSTVTHKAIPATTSQTGTKESPILLFSDDEGEGEESAHRPLGVNAAPQKMYLGVSPSDVYTFRGHGSAHDMMIVMGYKPDRGLGPNLRGSANSCYLSGVSLACLFSPRKCAALVD